MAITVSIAFSGLRPLPGKHSAIARFGDIIRESSIWYDGIEEVFAQAQNDQLR